MKKPRHEDSSMPAPNNAEGPRPLSHMLLSMAATIGLAVLPSVGNTESSAPGSVVPGLENFMKVSGRILCGSEPHGESAFETLKSLGVNTIVSVDGAVPQVDLARTAGIRYFHIPFGYDGIPQDAGHSLTRVVRDTTGVIYIHCHHGRHRGPAAAAIASQVEGTADDHRALEIMVQAGTSREYSGLWRDVKKFIVPATHVQLPRLVEVAPVESMARAMVRVNRRFEALKSSLATIHFVSDEHSHHAAVQDALLLHESLHEATRNLSSGYDQEFRTWLTQSGAAAKAAYDSLRSGSADTARRQIRVLQQSCTQCHKTYRN
ncbi:MAG: hypothetical protein P8J37_24065 [Fuerstiella sp.]|nr:hypothetical protein [Fuerstiella sp.]